MRPAIAGLSPDIWRWLDAPLGVPGSGRVRYGAAMELFVAGLIDEDQLEVYREASAHDARDPEPILAERGLGPIPGAPRPQALATGSRGGQSVNVPAPDTTPQGAP